MDTTKHTDFLGSTEKDDIGRALKRIVGCLHAGDNVVFLFGAGMSHTAGVPNGKELAKKLLIDIFFPRDTNPPPLAEIEKLLDRYPFEAVAGAVETALEGRKNLTTALTDILLKDSNSNSYNPQQEHQDFVSICNAYGGRLAPKVFTTNFEFLIENELGDRGCTITEKNISSIDKFSKEGKIPVIHLHGTLGGDYYITEKDVFKEPQQSGVLSEFYSALSKSDVFVFVGYSMNDPDLRWILKNYRELLEQREECEKLTYFVSPAINEYDFRLGKKIWEERKVRWIPESAEQFFIRLKKATEDLDMQNMRKAIARKYDIDPENEDSIDDAVCQTADLLRTDKTEATYYLYEALSRAGVHT